MRVMAITIDRSGLCDRVLTDSAAEPYLRSDAGELKHTETKSYIDLTTYDIK